MAAAVKILLSQQGSRRCLWLPNSYFRRYFCSVPKPYPDPLTIEPVSYPVRPEHESQENSQEQEQPQQQSPGRRSQQEQGWSREDFRYMKDAPPSVSITPVSYATRVAPLPEDRIQGRDTQNVDMERERMRIEGRGNLGRRVFKVVEEERKVALPFPRLIKPVKKEKKPLFDLNEAIKQVKANARNTFDETVEAHVKLGIDKSRSDLIVRGTLALPHGGKKVLRVAVFAEGADADEARAAGADIVGGVELIDQITKAGKIDFDHCFTTPQFFPRIAKLGKILNRQGLMPDLKQGTVVSDVSKAVKNAKKNQIKFKMDKTAIVHVGLGKVSFTEESLRENASAFMNALLQAKPAGLKKTSKYAGYVTSFHICSTVSV
ncbi:54S RIBOSOMAL PROTEIN L1 MITOCHONDRIAL [Salix purpurea]|uniref:Large ribosomal subunit protein uL1c n=1 Tax=Salix purpurea TaxID=77065 RepID=A0A9Q0P2D4_SALPP|nr:54S RIBOSOMAL PROTEIN L1 MITOCHONDRIAL [Salix purpurea]